MKAAIRRVYGAPKAIKIETLKQPVPKANEVLIRVKCTTLNRTDGANLQAKPFFMRFILGLFKPSKIVLGTDFSGVIEAVGSNVSSFKINDRVFGFNDLGAASQAEYLVVNPKNTLLKIADHISFESAVASLEGASYAYRFLKKANIKSGQKILINGATGAIGSALLQFLKSYDVTITATCATKNIELIKSLGAHKVIDYTVTDFTKQKSKYDMVLDTVGKSRWKLCKPALKDHGIYISSELGPRGENLFLALFIKRVKFPIPYPLKISLPFIKQQLDTENFKPLVDRTYDLDTISEAYTYVLKGQKTGNVLIKI